MVVLVFVFLMMAFSMGTAVFAAVNPMVTLQVTQSFVTSGGATYPTSQQVQYTLTGSTASTPMPGGATGGTYTVTAAGNSSEGIVIDYPVSGTYMYTINEEIPASFEYGWTPTTYAITVYADGSNTPIVIIKNSAGEKVPALYWSYTYVESSSSSSSSSNAQSSSADVSSASNAVGGGGVSPQTGDDTQMLLWVILAAAAAAGILICSFYIIRQRKQKP